MNLIRPLPYPGYSWSFTQHAVALNASVLKGLLTCALPFDGAPKGYQSDITQLIVETGILTENVREGKADAWRDYQQVLPELGLMHSTKISPSLKLTPISYLYISGDLSHQALMSMQSLRYQYPNGQKNVISPKVKAFLIESGTTVPEDLITLQISAGVLVKPGCLILRVLIGLMENNFESKISADECRVFLMPCKTNSEWDVALQGILKSRQVNTDLSQIYRESRRNIQDWFKFLREGNLFESDGKAWIRLSIEAMGMINKLKVLYETEIGADAFWFPNASDQQDRVRWFEEFGAFKADHDIDIGNEAIVQPSSSETQIHESEFVKTNPINLSEFDANALFTKSAPSQGLDIKALAESVNAGIMKRHAKTILHDKLVEQYANKYKKMGAQVYDDPDSVDLYVKWNESESTLFEVKTVTKKSLTTRIRMGVGQVKEYRFRLQKELGETPDQALIIDRILPESHWQLEYLTDFMDVGLVSFENGEETTHPTSQSSCIHWR